MTASALRARAWRDRRTANGICHAPGCTHAAMGYYCLPCKRRLSPQDAARKRTGRATAAFLHLMGLLALGRCVACLQPVERFGPWRCRGCAKAHKYLRTQRMSANT